MDAKLLERIEGSAALIELFGEWPDFHDAEILDLYLSRSAPSWIRLDALRYPGALVTFYLDEVCDVSLEEFSGQNVIYCLEIKLMSDGNFRMMLAPCYGLSGHIDCRSIRVTYEPLPKKPDESGG